MIMSPRPLPMSPSYLAMVRGTRDLHQLLAAGKDDSPEADAIRDATDGPWQVLSEAERNRIGGLSEDLYSLVEPPPAALPMNPQAQAKLSEAFEARHRGEWDRALNLLRRWRAYIDPALLGYLRGSIWLEAGDPATAALFLEHAFALEHGNESYLALFLYALNIADPAAARERAAEILREHTRYSPVAVSRAADIQFMSAWVTSEIEARRAFEFLEPILKSLLAGCERQDLSEVDRSSYVMSFALLGFGYQLREEVQAARDCYSQALRLDPHNDALLVARGILLYGTSDQAIDDFATAAQLGSPLVWPYVFLAHHNLLSRRFDECRKLCERVLAMNASVSVRSEVAEWLAIVQAGLGFPAEMVRAAFENAIRLDACNEQAKRNLAAFEAANKPIADSGWDTRSVRNARTWGLAEWRLAGIAGGVTTAGAAAGPGPWDYALRGIPGTQSPLLSPAVAS